MLSEHIRKRHNVTLLLYHIVFPVKYRKKILNEEVEQTLKEVCLEISERYEINFYEIGVDSNHVHFLLQGLPSVSVTTIVTTIKSITSREIFKKHPEIKKFLWGSNLWTSGYYANTVSKYGNEEVIARYIKEQGQGNDYKKIHFLVGQMNLFDS